MDEVATDMTAERGTLLPATNAQNDGNNLVLKLGFATNNGRERKGQALLFLRLFVCLSVYLSVLSVCLSVVRCFRDLFW